MVDSYRPINFKEALKLLKNNDCILFAGGTDLMVKNKRWSGIVPSFKKPVIFIGHLKEIKGIYKDENSLRIGSACSLTEIAENKNVPEFIKNVILDMASPATRNIATIGGNICNASPAGDTLPLLYALNTVLVLESTTGEREVPIEKFIIGPGKTIINKDEILKEILIPINNFNNFSYKKVGTRKATALSKLSFFGTSETHDGAIKDIRIAFGAVAPTVVRAKDLENKLKGIDKYNLANMITKISNEYSKLINPIDDQRSIAKYRKKVSLNLLEKFLREVL